MIYIKKLAARDLESDQHVHAEKVNVFIDAVMTEAGTRLNELDAVAVGIGPGSYTGLRIGLSAAKGLCYALDIPIIGISTLRTPDDSARAQQPTLSVDAWPMIDAHRMEVFTQRLSVNGQGIDATVPLVLDEDRAVSFSPALVFGDGADKAGDLWLREGITYMPGIRPHASAMAQEAERRYAQGAFDDVAYLVPTYDKAANITQPKKKSVD